MNRLFVWTMRYAPQLLCAAALALYLCDVITIVAEGQQMDALYQDALPVAVKARAVVLTFIKPVVAPFILVFGAALLWRLDARPAKARAEAAE